MNKFYAVIEIQINDGVPAAMPVVIHEGDSPDAVEPHRQNAIGDLYAKLGYAYQHPRDYTAVIILDETGHNVTNDLQIPFVLDNREEKTPVFSVAEFQVNDGVLSAVPVNVQTGSEAESTIMQAYHNSLSYAWNVKRNYTMAAVIGTNGLNAKEEAIYYLPVEA